MRLFLALVPPPELRERLGTLADVARAQCGGRRIPEANLHLTLAFLGEQPAARADELATWLRTLRVPTAIWHLDRWGHFRRPGIVWVGSSHPPTALLQLQRDLWDGLEAFGIGERPRHFVPHVTLLRRATRPPDPALSGISLPWRYNETHLMQSVNNGEEGLHYVSLAHTIAPQEAP